jgi:hypothetical protein
MGSSPYFCPAEAVFWAEVLDTLTTPFAVVNMSNMGPILLLNERHVLAEDAFVELVVWSLSPPLAGSPHRFKYRLALVVKGDCVLRFDNEAGKGDHKHIGGKEIPYVFISAEALLHDFWNEVDRWRF